MKAIVDVVLVVLTVVLSACGAAPVSQVPIDPPAVEATAELTETPIVATATETPLSRPTLPPTWTPTVEPTPEPTRTPAGSNYVAATTPGGEVDPRVGNCLQFGPDLARNPSSVIVGNPVTVYWNPSGGGVFYYEVVLRDANGLEVDSSRRVPSSRQYTFSANLFDFNSVYTWTVTPFNSAADAICEPRTSELRAALR